MISIGVHPLEASPEDADARRPEGDREHVPPRCQVERQLEPSLLVDGASLLNNSATASGGAIDAVGTASLPALVHIVNATIAGSVSDGGNGGGVAVASGALVLHYSRRCIRSSK